jgi:iron complex outermembrane receptor protein
MVRRKIMRNHTFGVNGSVAYNSERLWLQMGGSYLYYTCPHWGDLEWVDGFATEQIAGRWYDNDVNKQDANLFVKGMWRVADGLSLFADLQYRYVDYKAWGVNDNFDWNTMQMQPINVDKQYHFFNPHVGVSYQIANRHKLFASFAIAQKEPTRSDFTDRYMFAKDQTQPLSERLYDYEVGYEYKAPSLSLGANLYYMHYKTQLIPTGMVNDSSDALNVNVPTSYRCGVELMAAWRVARWLTIGGNATFSRNKIRDYVDMLADSPTYGENLGDMTIAYSPDVVASAYLDFHANGFEAVMRTQYVGSQYFTNNEVAALSLDAYSVTSLDLGYTVKTKSDRSVRFGVAVYNLFNAEYCSNGYGYSYMWDGERYDEAYYFPQAPLHCIANVTVNF